jgi:hypothetical protein
MNFKKVKIFGIGALSLLSSVAFGQAGTRGGEVIHTSKGTQLRDLVDSDTCTWVSGYDLELKYPKIEEAIGELKNIHWYFGFALDRELRSIDFCFTSAQLKRPKNLIDDPEVLPFYQTATPATEIVGVRLYESKAVYLNQDLLAQLDPQQQVMLFIHETMHSFLDPNLAGRNDKLHTVIKAIRDIWDHLPMSVSSFATLMRRCEVEFKPESNPAFDTTFLEYALASDESRAQLILADQVNVAYLLKQRDSFYADSLIDSDAEYIKSIANQLPENLFGSFCRKKNTALITKLETQTSDDFDIDELCLRYPEYFSDPAFKAKTVKYSLEKSLNQILHKLTHLKVSLIANRVTISKDIEVIVANPDITTRSRIILELYPFLSSPGFYNGTAAAAFFQFAIEAAQILPEQEWIDTILANGAFKTAFNPKPVEELIEALPYSIDDEKQKAEDQIVVLYVAFKKALVSEVRNQVSDERADALEQAIGKGE